MLKKTFTTIREIENHIKKIKPGLTEKKLLANDIYDKYIKYGPIKEDVIRVYIDGAYREQQITSRRIVSRKTTQIYRKELLLEMDPDIQIVRQVIFNTSEAPFPDNYDKAIEWIENKLLELETPENRRKRALYRHELSRIQEMQRKKEILGPLIGTELYYFELPYKFECMHYDTPVYTRAFCLHSKELELLYDTIYTLSLLVPFSEYDLLRYILSGIKPKLDEYVVTEVFRGDKKKSLQILFNVGYLSFEKFKEIYANYRKEFDTSHKRNLSDKQTALYRLVQEIGEPPEVATHKGFNQYWDNILVEWNKRYPEKKYKTRQGIYKNYCQSIRNKL